MKNLISLLPVLVINTASAAVFNFNYSNLGVAGGSINDSVSMTSGGISVNVQAYTITLDAYGNVVLPPELTGSNGLYVSSSTSGNLGVVSGPSDGTNMDGGSSSTDPDEGLLFTFDQVISLDYINFDSFTSSAGDDFNLTVDGVNILTDFSANDSSLLATGVPGQFDEYTFNNVTGTQILIWADGDTDSFRIDTINASVVPVPAAAWLFGSGLLGLVAVARRSV